MESFPAYLRIVRYRGRAHPYWTPVAPLHRVFSYSLSYVYCAMGLTPLAVTLWGLLLAVTGTALVLSWPHGGAPFWAGLALVNIGVMHDACDGEVARYRLHHKMQSTATYRVGMFADFWAYAVLVQALLPVIVGVVAWQRGASHWLAVAGLAAAFVLLSSYVAGFARKAYWPGRGASPEVQPVSLAEGGAGWLRLARKLYFYTFETAMFTTHVTIVLAAWTLVDGLQAWAELYAALVTGAIGLAFLVGTAQTLHAFDRA